MAGTHLISSSLFIQSGSIAQFKSGIQVTGSVENVGSITAGNFIGITTDSTIELNVGKANSDGTFEEWEVTIGEGGTTAPVRITASGDFDNFTFIENQTLEEVGSNSTWKTVEKGPSNGLIKASHYERTYNESGVYEYLIIANNNNLLQTVVKGTTVTVTNPISSS